MHDDLVTGVSGAPASESYLHSSVFIQISLLGTFPCLGRVLAYFEPPSPGSHLSIWSSIAAVKSADLA